MEANSMHSHVLKYMKAIGQPHCVVPLSSGLMGPQGVLTS